MQLEPKRGGVGGVGSERRGPCREAREEFKDLIDRFIALQFLFDKQWKAVKVG